VERRSPGVSSPQPGGLNLEDGPSFLEILAAQREARRASGEDLGITSYVPCELSPRVETHPGSGYTERDTRDFDLDDETASVEARRRRLPRGFGQGLVEYSLLMVLVAVVVVVLLGTVGHQAQDVFSNLSKGLAT